MNPGTEWPAATIQYRLNLPHTLHSISPSLSALHTSRAAALHPEISAVVQSTHCPKCGTYHFSSDHPSHLVGLPASKKRKRVTSHHPAALQRRCHSCGFSIDACNNPSLPAPVQLPSDSPRTGATPLVSQTREIGQELSPPRFTAQTTHVLPLPSRQSRPKPSHTRTSALKNMLSRDRQREEEVKSQKKRKEGHEGLAAFLKGL